MNINSVSLSTQYYKSSPVQQNQTFGKHFWILDKPKNMRLTGNIVADTFRRYPKTIAAATALASIVGISSAVISNNSNDTIKSTSAIELAEYSGDSFFTPENIVNASREVLGEAWQVRINPKDNMVEVVNVPPQRNFSNVLDDPWQFKYMDSFSRTPAEIKAIFGLKDGVLSKYDDINNLVRKRARKSYLISGFDFDYKFKPGVTIKFPYSEVGKNPEASRLFIREQLIEIKRGNETFHVSHSDLL